MVETNFAKTVNKISEVSRSEDNTEARQDLINPRYEQELKDKIEKAEREKQTFQALIQALDNDSAEFPGADSLDDP